jgi:hypothetical protein
MNRDLQILNLMFPSKLAPIDNSDTSAQESEMLMKG